MSDLLNFIDLADGGRNQGGSAHTFKWVPVEDVESIPFPDGNNITDDVVLKSGKAWYTGHTTHNQGELTIEPGGGEDELPFYELDYSGFIPSQEMNNDKTFKILRTIECLLIVSDRNGHDRLLGDLDNGMRFTYEHTTGRTSSDRNGYSWSFTGRYSYSPYYYKGTADVYSLQQTTLLQLLNDTAVADVVNDIEDSNNACAILTGLLDTYGGTPFIKTDWADVGGLVYSTLVNGNELYALDFNNGRIRVYDITTGALDRTVLGFSQPYNLLFNSDKSKYIISDNNRGRCRVYDSSNDTQDFTFTNATLQYYAFKNGSSNLFGIHHFNNNLQEYTNAGATVGSAISLNNIGRAYCIYNDPNNDRVYVGGDNGNSVFGRLSYYDYDASSTVDITLNNVQAIRGISIYNNRLYLFTKPAIVITDINGMEVGRITLINSSNWYSGEVTTALGCAALFFGYQANKSLCLLST